MTTLELRIAELSKDMARGWQARLARHCGVKAPSVSDWVHGETKSLEGQNLLCAAEFFGVHPLWLNTGQGPKFLDKSGNPTPKVEEPRPAYITSGDLLIPQYPDGGSMGNGLVLEEKQPGIIKSWNVSREWIRLNVPLYTSAANLCIVTGFGPSMRPLYNPGDPLLMDRGVKDVDQEGVFFFRLGELGYIKQLQRIPTEDGLVLRAKSLNASYDTFDITRKMRVDFECFGKILTVWRSEQV